jgi:hypothetical protein
MHFSALISLFVFCLFSFMLGCRSKTPTPDGPSSDANVVALEDYSTIVSYEQGALTNPNILRYGGNSHLFVYDAGKSQVIELDSSGTIVNEFGRQGRGPGEFISVNNIFLNNEYLYAIDQIQLRISRFRLNGDLESTMNYGDKNSQAPPPPPLSPVPRAKIINNQPSVSLDGNVLLSAISPDSSSTSLYKLVNWNGDPVSDIGFVPEGSEFILDYDKYISAVANKKIPAYYRPHAFPVSDPANYDEFYFIYNAVLKIVKYDTTGSKRWEMDIPETPELDSLTTYFYQVSEKMSNNNRIALKTYVSGIGSEDGHLYLALAKYRNSSPAVWIHQFDTKGNLVRRYKLISKEANLVPIFAIDSMGQRIFVVTEEGEIRAYSF